MDWCEAYKQLVAGKKICVNANVRDEAGLHEYKDYWYINKNGELMAHREDGPERKKYLLDYLELTALPVNWKLVGDK